MTATTEPGPASRYGRLVLSEAAVALVLVLVAGVWAWTDPYTPLGTRAVLLRVAMGVAVSVGLSAVLFSLGGRVLRGIGWAVVVLRVPVLVVFPLGFLIPQFTTLLFSL
ncbi:MULTISPECIES: hypothetical protein [unclassified Streptomyces]|uniref:hypothetical protein n=1 Tax=unclassified Streptomyces TaxID=2593676 RepID=UPI003718B1CF